jgi:hypothetical protein
MIDGYEKNTEIELAICSDCKHFCYKNNEHYCDYFNGMLSNLNICINYDSLVKKKQRLA